MQQKGNNFKPPRMGKSKEFKIATRETPNFLLSHNNQASDDAKFDKYYRKIYKSNFNEDSPFLQKKISNSTYSKSYENFASKKIVMEEKLKIKCPKCQSPKEDSSSDKSCFHSSTTDYCKTIIRNKNFYINVLPFEKRAGIDLKHDKKTTQNGVSSINTYQKIKKEWVHEFFWKKYKKTPLKEQKHIRETLMKEACETEENDEMKMYKIFNSQFMKKLLVLSSFKKEFTKLTNTIEDRLQNDLKEDNKQNNEKRAQSLAFFSKYLIDQNMETNLQNRNQDSEIFKKLLFYQYFLTENLLKQNQTGLAEMSDVIFKMLSFLYENANTY